MATAFCQVMDGASRLRNIGDMRQRSLCRGRTERMIGKRRSSVFQGWLLHDWYAKGALWPNLFNGIGSDEIGVYTLVNAVNEGAILDLIA